MEANLMEVKKALIITDVTAPGGVDTYIIEMVRFAKADGWEVFVLMDSSNGSDLLYHSLINQKTNVIRKGMYHGENTLNDIEVSTKEVLQSINPDIVHVVCGSPRSAIIPRKVVKEYNYPLFFTEQYVDPNFEFTPWQREQIKEIYKKADCIIAVCEENKKLLEEKYLLSSEKITVIPNSIFIEENRVKKFQEQAVYNVLCIGRLAPQKGYDVLIRGISLIEPKLRERLKVTIVGDGPDNELLKSLSLELGVKDRFEFLGWIPDASNLISNYDLFLMPSRYEGQPFALLEAMSYGLPCIASKVSGIPELFAYGKNGTFTESENPKSISSVLTDFIDDPMPYVKKASVAIDYITNNHNLVTNMARLLEIWNSFVVGDKVNG